MWPPLCLIHPFFPIPSGLNSSYTGSPLGKQRCQQCQIYIPTSRDPQIKSCWCCLTMRSSWEGGALSYDWQSLQSHRVEECQVAFARSKAKWQWGGPRRPLGGASLGVSEKEALEVQMCPLSSMPKYQRALTSWIVSFSDQKNERVRNSSSHPSLSEKDIDVPGPSI